MKQLILVFIIFFTSCLMVQGDLKVQRCSGAGRTKELGRLVNVSISNCAKAPCTLKKGTAATIVQEFIPNESISDVKTRVSAVIYGAELSFIGVDGSSACDGIFHSSDNSPAGCSLKADEKYYYKKSFPILQLYPPFKMDVIWGLNANNGATLTCFKVAAKIVG